MTTDENGANVARFPFDWGSQIEEPRPQNFRSDHLHRRGLGQEDLDRRGRGEGLASTPPASTSSAAPHSARTAPRPTSWATVVSRTPTVPGTRAGQGDVDEGVHSDDADQAE